MTEPDNPLTPSRDLCGTMLVHRRLLNDSLTYRARRTAIENRALSYEIGLRTATRTEVTDIPVAVHVVHRTSDQNITDGQIHSQIAVLNDDFRATNSDVDKVPDVWKQLVADSRIEFHLATQDPNGAPTNGITRTATNRVSFTTDDGVKASATGGADPWPSDQYLNIWVCQLAGSLLGYAQFPGGSPLTDGVVIRHSAFGTEGTADAPFDLGRTATHEIGHWLNLFHIWGDDGGGCNNDDEVADTPNQARDNIGVPTFPHVTCNNGPDGDMFVNYMDYSDDIAMFMFTLGQKQRMDACLEGSRASFLIAQRAPVAPAGSGASASGDTRSEETDDVARLRKKVRRLRRENERLTALVDGIRASLATSDNDTEQ